MEDIVKIFWRSCEYLVKIMWTFWEDLVKILWWTCEDLVKFLQGEEWSNIPAALPRAIPSLSKYISLALYITVFIVFLIHTQQVQVNAKFQVWNCFYVLNNLEIIRKVYQCLACVQGSPIYQSTQFKMECRSWRQHICI